MDESLNNNESNASTSSQLQQLVQSGLGLVGWLTILGLTLRLTVRDSIFGISTLYYMTPLALLVVGASVGLMNSLLKRKKTQILFWGVMFVVLSLWWKETDWKFHPSPTQSENDLVILLANIAQDQDFDHLANIVEEVEPDLIGFLEALALTDEQKHNWSTRFPDYNWTLIGGGTQLLAKGEISSPWVKPLEDGTRISRSIVNVKGATLHCFIIDVASTLFLSRAPALDLLTEFVEDSIDENVIILGDFNTPRDSVHFDDLRKNHANLLEKVGQSYAATWPQPLPILTLDQIWVNKQIEPVACEHRYNQNSDHSIVIGRIRVKSKRN
ncbi:endonuclease/exonuclease/phosphatase family protein [Thalassoglobus sp.]|uniref:endonuclease/exonuclease/phosphatase family protein n=1 Tax=Thalassoglobus sp. TaxID=2795869 RepID=UPI003AA9011F